MPGDAELLAAMISPYRAAWDDTDPHANFKAEVAAHTLEDPFSTLSSLAADTGIPVGSLVRYVLCRYAASGAEALMAMGPLTFSQMEGIVARAEQAGTVEARAEAFSSLAAIVRWLRQGIELPEWRVS